MKPKRSIRRLVKANKRCYPPSISDVKIYKNLRFLTQSNYIYIFIGMNLASHASCIDEFEINYDKMMKRLAKCQIKFSLIIQSANHVALEIMFINIVFF